MIPQRFFHGLLRWIQRQWINYYSRKFQSPSHSVLFCRLDGTIIQENFTAQFSAPPLKHIEDLNSLIINHAAYAQIKKILNSPFSLSEPIDCLIQSESSPFMYWRLSLIHKIPFSSPLPGPAAWVLVWKPLSFNILSALSLSNLFPGPPLFIHKDGTVMGAHSPLPKWLPPHTHNLFDALAPEGAEELRKQMGTVPTPLTLLTMTQQSIHCLVHPIHFGKTTLFTLQTITGPPLPPPDPHTLHNQKIQSLGLLTGHIAHDFNNLLTAIIGFCDLRLAHTSVDEEAFQDLMQIKQNAQRGANFIQQLLSFSKPHNLDATAFDAVENLAQLKGLLNQLCGAPINIRTYVPARPIYIYMTLSYFEQIIINIVLNARDAIQGTGEIVIRVQEIEFKESIYLSHSQLEKGKYACIAISDKGHGIQKKDLPHIFEPFFSTKASQKGTGLGLAAVYSILTNHGGGIDVDSTPGSGTCMRFYFPLHKAGPPLAPPVTVAPILPLHSAYTILCVEDEDSIRLLTRRALEAKGYRILEAKNGQEALHIYQDHKPDLIITDFSMPDMDGMQLIAAIHKQFPTQKILLTSGYIDQKRVSPLISFLAKPFSINLLIQKVQEQLQSEPSSALNVLHSKGD